MRATERLQIVERKRKLRTALDGLDVIDFQPQPGAADDAAPAVTALRVSPQPPPLGLRVKRAHAAFVRFHGEHSGEQYFAR